MWQSLLRFDEALRAAAHPIFGVLRRWQCVEHRAFDSDEQWTGDCIRLLALFAIVNGMGVADIHFELDFRLAADNAVGICYHHALPDRQ